MELTFTSDEQSGRDYDEWFSAEVENGLAAAERGEFIDHADIRQMIDRRYPG